MSDKRLDRNYFAQDILLLCKLLLNKIIVRKVDGVIMKFKIVEVEAYIGPEDKACHAYNNKKTKKTNSFYLENGHLYVFKIYMGYALNIICGKNSTNKNPMGILIRALEPMDDNINKVCENRKIPIKVINKPKTKANLTNGPCKLTQASKINMEYDGFDFCNESQSDFYIIDNTDLDFKTDIVESKRINIDYAEEYKDKLWRFYIKNNPFVSVI